MPLSSIEIYRRKDMDASPYINHPIAVVAALYDTVEDTETTSDELEEHFGAEIADLVRELTDDKTLEKQRRKELQIERARSASPRAKQLKIADKTWAKQVVDGCRGVDQDLEAAFDAALERASHLIEG